MPAVANTNTNTNINNTNIHLESIMAPEELPPIPLISDHERVWAERALSVLLLVLVFVGVATNAINIRVFAHQGLSADSNTVGLFALAMSDLLGSFFLLPYTAVSSLLWLALTPATFRSFQSIRSLAAGIPHLAMSRVACCVTVYLAVERCLCVLAPFKVKAILRPRVAAAAMTIIYAAIAASFLPFASNMVARRRFSAPLNATFIAIHETDLGRRLTKFNGLVFNTVLPTAAVIVVTIATGLMLYTLDKHKKWRERAASSGGNRDLEKGVNSDPKRSLGGGNRSNSSSSSSSSRRDVEMLKMVLVVTGVFLVCLSASLVPGFASVTIPGFSKAGINKNIFTLFYQYKFAFDLINSSLNFFLYLRISSRFKTAFNEVFGGRGGGGRK